MNVNGNFSLAIVCRWLEEKECKSKEKRGPNLVWAILVTAQELHQGGEVASEELLPVLHTPLYSSFPRLEDLQTVQFFCLAELRAHAIIRRY